jgi:hypothetical protein
MTKWWHLEPEAAARLLETNPKTGENVRPSPQLRYLLVQSSGFHGNPTAPGKPVR